MLPQIPPIPGAHTSPNQGLVRAVPGGWQTGPRLASKVTNPENITTPILKPAGKVWKVSKGAPMLRLSLRACPGSWGLLATAQLLLPVLTAVSWPALCRKVGSISSAEATWTRRGGKGGRTVRGGAHRATERQRQRLGERRQQRG